ncbi:MAG: hypothetical protein FWF18_05995 [Dehalococcoidia bacterium]|nr:hypothetical protein [Dehalococcoidia bacterium]
MPAAWIQALSELEDFISATPEVQITNEVVTLPDSVRPQFYRYFNNVRAAFIAEKFSVEIEQARELAVHFGAARETMCQKLELEDIEIGSRMRQFFETPGVCLERLLFDPLFEVVKHKLEKDQFEKRSTDAINELFTNLFHTGYNLWVTMSIINAVDPSAAFIVPMPDNRTEPDLTDAEHVPGGGLARVPALEKPVKVSFEHIPFTALLVPRIIVHSRKLACFLSFRTDYHDVYRRDDSFKDPGKWTNTIDLWRKYGKNDLWPDIGIYIGTSADELSLVADYSHVVKPQLLVESMDRVDWHEKRVPAVNRHHEISQPPAGGFVVCREPVDAGVMQRLKPVPMAVPETVSAEGVMLESLEAQTVVAPDPLALSEGISILEVGYDSAGIEPVVHALLAFRNTLSTCP